MIFSFKDIRNLIISNNMMIVSRRYCLSDRKFRKYYITNNKSNTKNLKCKKRVRIKK